MIIDKMLTTQLLQMNKNLVPLSRLETGDSLIPGSGAGGGGGRGGAGKSRNTSTYLMRQRADNLAR